MTILNRYGALKKGTVYHIRRLMQAVTTEGPCSHLSVEVLAGLVILHLVLKERPLAHLDVHDVRVAEGMQEVFQLNECLPSILHFPKIPSNTRHVLDISTLLIFTQLQYWWSKTSFIHLKDLLIHLSLTSS